ncbi:MAG: alpha/beta hydrolase [Opitutus sp.]
MPLPLSRLLAVLACLATAPLTNAAETVINLWPEGFPGVHPDAGPETDDGKGHYTHIHHPTLVVYAPPPRTANRTAVIYAPGGGYTRVSSGVNGGIVTEWLNSLGITVFMLKYRHADYGHPAPLQDALRAVRLVRSRAAEYGIDPDHLGFLGGSAGGHLAASAGTLYDAPEGRTGAALDPISARPNFLVLIFSMISLRDVRLDRAHPLLGPHPTEEAKHHLSVDEQVTKDTPPTFLVHSAEDKTVPVENSLLFYSAMRRAGAPIEMHLYAKGPHGDGMSPELGPIAEWPKLCATWMRFNGWLPKSK